MKERIIFESYFGSKLYGTNSETSDTDIKGVFLPELNDLILGSAPKHYVESTGSDSTHNTKDDIDKTYYSLQYFLELVSKGETNAMDILFAYTNKEAVLKSSSEWKYLIENIDKVLSKNVNAFLGYCKGQCIKYSLKGDKLANYTLLRNFLKDLVNKNIKNEDGEWLDLGTALREFKEYSVGAYSDYEKSGKVIGKRAPVYENMIYNKRLFGDHSYICIMNNGELYLMIFDVLFNMNESIVSALHKVERTIAAYGKRAENAMKNNGVDFKALSHCVRVLYQVKDLLTTGRIHFPLKDVEFIKSIKYKTTNMTYEEILNKIEEDIKYIDEKLLPNSKLPEKADKKFIDDFILKCYNGYFKNK